MTLVFLHSNDLWPLPPHLKHKALLSPMEDLGAFFEGAIDVFSCGLEKVLLGALEAMGNCGLLFVEALAYFEAK